MTDSSTVAENSTRETSLDMSQQPFHWHTYDLNRALPRGWDTDLLDLAAQQSVRHIFRPTMSSAREAAGTEIAIESVTGEVLCESARWLYELYLGSFRALAERYTGEPLQPTSTRNRALSLNLQRYDSARYPCHVDSNPAQGLLYLTDCDESTGGALVIARSSTARDIDEVDADCTVLYPRRGHLIIFDARAHPHYVQPLRSSDGLRAVVTMNYYSSSCPETVRPAGLDEQLFESAPR
ncbi:MAG: 2OG-Fe(II) oxygenase [Nocardia sp.]|nr:2OG-Fe(II) oxygenase [Nocardia sp.]